MFQVVVVVVVGDVVVVVIVVPKDDRGGVEGGGCCSPVTGRVLERARCVHSRGAQDPTSRRGDILEDRFHTPTSGPHNSHP